MREENRLDRGIGAVDDAALDDRHWPAALSAIESGASRVGPRDPAAWSASLINAIYAAMLGEAPWTRFLTILTCDFPSGIGVLTIHNVDQRRGSWPIAVNLDTAAAAAYEAHYARINPWLARIDQRPVGLAVRADAMCPRPSLLRSEFYHDFLKPLGIETGHGITLHADGGKRMLLSVLHGGMPQELDGPITRTFACLQPHLRRAFELCQRRNASEATISIHGQLMASLNTGVIYLTENRRIGFANREARALLERGAGIGLDAVGRLVVADSSCSEQINDLLVWWGASDRPIVRTVAIPRHDARPLQAILFRPSRDPAEIYFGGAVLALLVTDPDHRWRPSDECLRTLYGLTPAEARVAAGICDGDSLVETARRLAIAHETARQHLKRITEKVGCRRQSDLVRVLLSVPGAFSR